MCSAIDLIKKWKRSKRRKTGANNVTANNLSNNDNNNNKSQCTQLRKTCARTPPFPLPSCVVVVVVAALHQRVHNFRPRCLNP